VPTAISFDFETLSGFARIDGITRVRRNAANPSLCYESHLG